MLDVLSIRYPEKTFYLGQVFNDATNSYKLLWSLGLLSLLQRSNSQTLPLADVLTEMATAGWHPVCLYRLTLGRQDKLQHATRTPQAQTPRYPTLDFGPWTPISAFCFPNFCFSPVDTTATCLEIL